MTDLLACPFCGDDGEKGRQTVTMMNDEHTQFDRITCRCCGAMAPELNWQKRTPAAASEATAAQQDGWQPIETAPKDGRTMLLGCFNSHKKWRTMRGQWMSEEYIAENWEDPDDATPGWYETIVECDDIPNCWYIEPTHFMPLPAAPAQLRSNK